MASAAVAAPLPSGAASSSSSSAEGSSSSSSGASAGAGGLAAYYQSKLDELEVTVREKTQNLRRLEAQRNALNTKVRGLREELVLLQEPGSYVGEVVKVMGKSKVLVKVGTEGKYLSDIEKDIDVSKLTPNTRVALRSDSYALHRILPTKVDPLVSLMK
jgi:26S proteasome regulatory subunit T6